MPTPNPIFAPLERPPFFPFPSAPSLPPLGGVLVGLEVDVTVLEFVSVLRVEERVGSTMVSTLVGPGVPGKEGNWRISRCSSGAKGVVVKTIGVPTALIAC